MVRVYGYNAEREGKGFSDVYLMALAFGVLMAIMFILGGKGIKFLVGLFIEYWVWAVGFVGGVIILRRFVFRKKSPANYPISAGQGGL